MAVLRVRRASDRIQNTVECPRQGKWIRITALHHSLFGQVVRVVRSLHRDGGVRLVVEDPDGHSQQIPLTWTDAAADDRSGMPTLLFSPGSLRALVRLVRSHRLSMPAEACQSEPDAVEHLPGGDTPPADRAVVRSAAPPAAEPPARGKGKQP